jgi:hypothetical protein
MTVYRLVLASWGQGVVKVIIGDGECKEKFVWQFTNETLKLEFQNLSHSFAMDPLYYHRPISLVLLYIKMLSSGGQEMSQKVMLICLVFKNTKYYHWKVRMKTLINRYSTIHTLKYQ